MIRIGYVVLIIISLLLVGCGGQSIIQPITTATPIPPTATATPMFVLKCDINTDTYGFEIIGETGTCEYSYNETTNYEYDDSGQMSGITVNVNQDLSYENNQHEYHIRGTIKINPITNELTYNITATGDTFGNSPQTCKYP